MASTGLPESSGSMPLTPSTAERGTGRKFVQEPPPLLKRLYYASTITGLHGALRPALWARTVYWWWYGHSHMPNIIKTYESKPGLPVRIFFPENYDQTSPSQLPTILTIHGGGFVMGQPEDDDAWNRTFCDSHNHLVIALNYAKAPWSTFPGPIDDVVSLIIAVLGDESLPIDKSRVSLCGFSAGGNLAITASQSKEIRGLGALGWGIKAVIPMYPVLDFTVAPREKADRRYYKPSLKGLRGKESDYLLSFADMFDWAYIPYGTDKSDRMLSPGVTALRSELPDHVCVVGAELDMLAYDGWSFARRLANMPPPDKVAKVGRPEVGPEKGALVSDGDERFGFLSVGEGDEGQVQSVKWILVPDALHGYDMHLPPSMVGDEESWMDGNGKAGMVMKEVAGWLENIVYASLEEEGE